MRVLVVDDMQAVRERLAARIADIAGVSEVLQASDGLDALAVVSEEQPNVVVLDLHMPRTDGFTVLAALGMLADPPTTIVVTNHVEYRSHAMQGGASFFFEKATELDGLMMTLTDLASPAQSC